VIALGRGGVLESVPAANPRCGILYPEEAGLDEAIAAFEHAERGFDPQQLQAAARPFSESEFMSKMRRALGVAPSASSAPLR
jgi:hypothetical protein